jgi:hypothetical protein
MASPYFVSVDRSPEKLRMFFGRRREIQQIADYLQNGESVLLIGERRMGKTFLLHMIGDFARRGPDFYADLLDRETGALLAEIRRLTASYCWAFVDMLRITAADGFYFNVLAELVEDEVERLVGLSPIDDATFADEVTRVSDQLSRTKQRAVVLVDESEKLCDLYQCEQVLSCLKSVMQQCDAVDFLLAGDIKPHQQATPMFANLQGALRPIYLAPLHPDDAKALIEVPVAGTITFEDPAIQRILELTGSKPSLIHILCGHLYDLVAAEAHERDIPISLSYLDQLWESELREKVFESFEGPLRDFFEGLQDPEKAVFSFLAHNPVAAEADIAKALGIDVPYVRRALHKLHSAHKIEEAESGFRIGARIVEEFGARFVAYPVLGGEPEPGELQVLRHMLGGESTTVEYKASMRWDYNRQELNKELERPVAKTVAAFLNSVGGTLLIGVRDDGTVVGIEEDLKTISRPDRDGYERTLRQVLSDLLGAEFSQYQRVSFEETEGKTVCIVQVQASPEPVYVKDKGSKEFHIRVGPSTLRLDVQEAHNYIGMRWRD